MSNVTVNGFNLVLLGISVTLTTAINTDFIISVGFAKTSIDFLNIPQITSQTVSSIVLYEGKKIQSYRPSKTLNAITGFLVNKGYYISSKEIDFSEYFRTTII